MNKAILIGRLTRDPETRYTQGADAMAISRFSLAVDRRSKKKDGEATADFINCVAFGKNGEFVEKYFRKGMKVAVVGHIQTGSYKDKDGKTVYTTDVVVDEQEFAEGKNDSDENKTSTAPRGYGNVEVKQESFMNIPDDIDEELPFN